MNEVRTDVPLDTVILNLKYVQVQLQEQIRAAAAAMDELARQAEQASARHWHAVQKHASLVDTERAIFKMVQDYAEANT